MSKMGNWCREKAACAGHHPSGGCCMYDHSVTTCEFVEYALGENRQQVACDR